MNRVKRKWLLLIIVLAFAAVSLSPYYGAAETADPAEVPASSAAPQPSSDQPLPSLEAAEQPAAEPAVVQTAEQAPSTEPSVDVGLYPITAVKKVLENERFELYIDEKTANIRVVDKRTSAEWLGAPQVSRTFMPNNKKFIDSPVHIKYTTGAGVSQTYTLKEKENEVAIELMDDAVRAQFTLGLEQLAFAIEYRLTDDGLVVTIPYDSLQENGAAKFISLEPLPFIHAASETDEGALVLPDGSGALLHFREQHPMYLKGYSEPIYGPDHAFKVQDHTIVEQGWVQQTAPKEYAALPVFGIYKNGTGVLGIVEEGQFDAKINGTPSGVRAISLYRTSAELLYRKDDVIFVGSSGQIPYYQGRKIEGDRKVRYVLLEGEGLDYVDLAHAYRNYLTEHQAVEPVKSASPKLTLHLLGGLLRDEIIGSTFIKMTTFDQAKQMIDAFSRKGMTELEITLDGWSDGGLYGNQPDHFPIERELGGSKALKELAAYAKEKGISFYLKANYVRAFSDSDGIQKSKDAIRGLDREVMESWNYYVSTRWNAVDEKFYYLKPQRVLERRIGDEAEDFAELGIAGVHLDYMGDTLYSDQDPDLLFSRKETAEVWTDALDLLRVKAGGASVDYGFAYALGHVDRIDQAPLDSSQFIYTDEAVPFYQIVVHGLVPYTGKPVNLRDDSKRELLRAIEYGALPSFVLTYEDSGKLQRTMAQDELLSTQYGDWLDTAKQQYDELLELYVDIASETIANHERLQQDVYRTTYSNGVQIIVNYSDSALTVDGVLVPGLGYAVAGR